MTTSRLHPDDFDIEATRTEWIGRVVSRTQGRYPVEFDPIRRHCHMTGDTNPLFLDPAAAATGPHGAVVVPPSMLPIYFASNGPWPPRPRGDGDRPRRRPSFTSGIPTPGDRGINMGIEWSFHEPILVGDRLRSETRIADVYQKPIRLDPAAVWIVTEASVINQHERVAATWRNTVLVHRSPRQIAEDGNAERSPS